MSGSVDLLDQLKGWQTGLGSFFGLVALLVGALFNFQLNRKRDDRLRAEESLSVAVALYGEILLLRQEIAKLARTVANIHIRGFGGGTIEIDHHFLEAHPLPDTLLYKALAPKIGLLPPDLILSITEFYANFQEVRVSLPLLVENEGRGYSYGPTAVLRPAVRAVEGVVPALRRIEAMAAIGSPAADPDLGRAEAVIEIEDLQHEATSSTPS